MSIRKRVSGLTLVCLGLLLPWPGGRAEAAPTEYDFASLGAATGGFKPQGNRFLVSETFVQDGTMMYLNLGTTSTAGQIIKADNTSLAQFDFEDMSFLGWADDTIQTMTITGTLAGGGTTSVAVTNKAIEAGVDRSLVTDWGANLSTFVGVTELSFDITMAAGGALWNFDFQTITIDNEVPVDQPGVTPTIQASSLGAVVLGPTETTLSWTNGNGSKRILFARAGTTGAPTATDGTSYTPNADFSSAADIGGGWRCVYGGAGTMAIVRGLSASTTYRFVVYEMDGAGTGVKYLATLGTNAGSATTISPSFLTWTSGTARTLNAENFWSWPAGDHDDSDNTYVLHRYAGYTGGGTTEVQKWNGGAWSTLTSFDPAAAGCVSFNDHNSMDVAGVDTLHVATGAAFGSGVTGARGIRYGLFSGGTWSFSTAVSLQDPNGWKNSSEHALAVDGSGNPHLLYIWDDASSHTQYFVLRSKSGAAWSDVRTLSTIVGSNSYNEVKGDFALLIDGSDRFHILYLRETAEGVRDLRYATNAPSGTWTDEVVVGGNGENLFSLTAGLDSNSKVHMALSFGDWYSEGTRYMTNASGDWVATDLAPSGSGYWPGGLRVRSNDDIAISLIGASDTKVMVKQGTNPWYVGAALAGPGSSEGYYVVTFTDDRKVMTTYANSISDRPRVLSYRLASLVTAFTVDFETDGTAGASLTGTTSQPVPEGGDATAVTANAPAGYHFVDWTGTGGFSSTDNPLTVTGVTQNLTITAHFAINQYTVTLQTDGTPGATLTGSTSQVVNHGGSATAVTANVPTGYHFVNWTGTGGLSSTDNPLTVTGVTQNLTITANYAINQYTVVFQTDGTLGATLTGSTSQIVDHGGSATAVTANVPTGYHFVNWTGTGGFSSTDNPLTVTGVTQNLTITANFAINWYVVDFQTDGTPGATLTGSTSQLVDHGGSATAVTAHAPPHFEFVNWAGTGGFTSTSNPLRVTGVTQNLTFTANFDFVRTVVISTRFKTVAGTFYPGDAVTYTITIANTGSVDQTDNAGNEFVDILPSAVSLASASATTGTAVVDPPSGMVTWNGTIAMGRSVTITVNATLRYTASAGSTVSNQGSISYDANGDGINDATTMTDDPAVVGPEDPTSFEVLSRPLDYYTLTPCRLADTRGADGSTGGPILSGGTTREFPAQGLCGVPVGARAIAVNITAVQPSGSGHFTLFPTGTTVPLSSCLNFRADRFAVASNAVVALSDYATHAGADLALHTHMPFSGTVHVVLDVVGYLE